MAKRPAAPLVDMERALLDPAATFRAPEVVLAHPSLSEEQKIEILRRWEYDAAEVAVAVEEGMPGTDEELLDRILAALEKLGGVDAVHTGPGKQHGMAGARKG